MTILTKFSGLQIKMQTTGVLPKMVYLCLPKRFILINVQIYEKIHLRFGGNRKH